MKNPIAWIKKHNHENASYELIDGKINVNGNVDIRNYDLEKIPIPFGIISGYFDCSDNKLNSLKGAPLKCENFHCFNNLLTDLKYIPENVTFVFNFAKNNFDEILQKRLNNCKTWEDVLTLSYINKSNELIKLNDDIGIFE